MSEVFEVETLGEVAWPETNDETAERPFLVRTYAAEVTTGDGRTVDVRIVPYGVAEEVSDNKGRTFYREQWEPGAFDEQLVAGHRLKVLLNFEHQSGFGNVVGKGIALRSETDGLHGSFRVANTPAGEQALELVNDGILDSVSLEAIAKKSVRTAEGVVKRMKAHLHNVALCRYPAFADAKVLAVREGQPNTILDEEFLPVDLDPELVERCRRLGISLPQRYQAHPETDTSADADTSDESAPAATDNIENEE